MTNHLVPRDIETRSTVNLKKVGLYNYVTHPTTEVLCVGYCVDDEPVRIWHPGDPVPHAYRDAARNGWTMVAHNAPFEMTVERHILGPRHGFPLIPIECNVCTMAIANALALPPKLEKLAKALELTHQKDAVGNRLMLQMIKPRKARKHEDTTRQHWFDDSERMARLDRYCIDDVESTREVAQLLPWLTDDEYAIWLLDQKINLRGVQIDRKLALAAREIINAAGPYLDAELAQVTGGQVTAVTQVAALGQWMSQFCEVTSLDKAAIDAMMSTDLPAPARRALELRYLGAQAAAKKVAALLAHCDATGRVRNAFVYHASSTGRWTSRGAQLHNLKRSATETKDIAKAVLTIGSGNLKAACLAYDNPLSVIGDLIRAMVTAKSGHVLLGADFSGIEARVTAWLAGEESKLQVFREFDAGRGPDPYLVAAARIFSVDLKQLAADYKAETVDARDKRQVGKASELAFSFMGGLNAYLKFDPYTKFSALEIHRFKTAWRVLHPNIEKFWGALSSAAWKATQHPGEVVPCGDKLTFAHSDGCLWIMLPSGRRLCYPETRITEILIPPKSNTVIVTPAGTRGLIFKDSSSGMWRDVKPHAGTWCENVTQAVARDLLAQAMLRLDAEGWDIVAHIHDEAVCEVAAANADRLLPAFRQVMMMSPDWAAGLPIAVKAWTDLRFTK
jgi:DNA polymerase